MIFLINHVQEKRAIFFKKNVILDTNDQKGNFSEKPDVIMKAWTGSDDNIAVISSK